MNGDARAFAEEYATGMTSDEGRAAADPEGFRQDGWAAVGVA